jgi:PAS domain S-box-containing protein
VGSEKIIIANIAACKLLGYSKKELLTKSGTTIFNIHESSFRKMLKQRAAEGQSSALVTAIKKSGKLLHCEITSSVFMDEDNIEKAITTLVDMGKNILKQKKIDSKKEKVVAGNIILARSKQRNIDTKKEKIVTNNIILAKAKSDARLVENNEWIKNIAKASYDVMWDWDIITSEIYVGDSIEEVFGYKVQNNTVHFTDFSRCLLPEEKDTVEKKLWKTLASRKKTWSDSYRFKRHDGSVASTTSRASIVRDEEGKAVRLIGAIQDISNLQDMENKLEKQIAIQKEHSEISLMTSKLSFDRIWDWNLLTNEFFLGGGFKELFGYNINKNKGNIAADWINYLHPDDKDAVEKALKGAIASSASHWELTYRFVRADGSIAKVFNRASIIRDAAGKAYRMIGAMQDISKQTVLEERLEQEIKLKENKIAEATEQAKKAERADIGKELHDNVNQLLGASRMYIEMAKRGEKDSKMYLNRSSEYTLTAIEEIRKLSKVLTTDDIKNIGLCESINNIARDTMELNPVKISCALDSFIEDGVNDKFKLNVFRIVQEELNNILKHAHATEISIGLSQNKKSIILSIIDNGIGFDTRKKRKGIGIANIKSRAASYQGTADFISQAGEGCVLTVVFPLIEGLLNKRSGLELMDDKKSFLIEKIKNIIVELAHSDDQLKINSSAYLTKKLQYDYTYLANLFVEVEGITIQKFIISQKIERVKELIVYDELNLTEIAWKLHYSSVGHLSNQFKKVTGLTPTYFKQLKHKQLPENV